MLDVVWKVCDLIETTNARLVTLLSLCMSVFTFSFACFAQNIIFYIDIYCYGENGVVYLFLIIFKYYLFHRENILVSPLFLIASMTLKLKKNSGN